MAAADIVWQAGQVAVGGGEPGGIEGWQPGAVLQRGIEVRMVTGDRADSIVR